MKRYDTTPHNTDKLVNIKESRPTKSSQIFAPFAKMKVLPGNVLTTALTALSVWSILCSTATVTTVAAMKMTNMLMGNTLESFLSDLVSLGDITIEQKSTILTMADFASSNIFSQAAADDASDQDEYRTEAFASEPSKQELRAFLYSEVSAGGMELEAAEIISSTLSLGPLYPDGNSEGLASLQQPPAPATYSGEGNVVRVGRWNGLVSTATSFYNGIWGYAVGDREYALQCHGQGFNIIDITDPTAPFRVQFVPMEGGGYWRDAATHHDSVTGKSYAYVGSQGNQGGGTNPNLFVFDLSNLSGDVNAPNGVDSSPCVYLNLGMTGLTHTINVARGLLFLHTAYSSNGCRVYDLTTNPMNPKYLFNTSGSGRDCHDSGVIENVNGRDLWVVSDGGGRRQRIWDITNVGASWPTGTLPPLFGQTNQISGIYAHSNWVSDDKRYLFSWDENNVIDMSVHDITNPAAPIEINLFQYSENSQYNAIPHNGEVRGKYLFVAYYEAGLRVFDISNPYAPLEVGKAETYRDTDGDGIYTRGITGSYDGAWNTYPFLPSGNVLVSDMYGGLFIVRADPPYPAPSAPTVTAQRDGFDNVILTWNVVDNARGYSVERSFVIDGVYELLAEHMTTQSFLDSSARGQTAFYKINAVNGEGVGTSSILSIAPNPSSSPTKLPTGKPSSPPTNMPTKQPTNACIPKGQICPSNPLNCCSKKCKKGKCT